MGTLYRPGLNFWQPARGSQRPLWPFTINRDSPQAEGLIGWWPFAPPGGGTLFDLSDNRNHGTLTNMAPDTDWVGNEILGGHALAFDGSNDRVNMGDVRIWDGLTAASWVLWINKSSTGEDQAFLSKWQDSVSTTFLFEFDADPGGEADLFIAHAADSAGQARGVAPTGTFNNNQWYHVAIIFDGSGAADSDRLKLYVDGLQITLTFPGSEPIPSSLFNSTDDFEIGSDVDISRFFPGQITDVKAYNRALTSSVVHKMWNPRTRWDLQYPLRQRVYFDMVVGAKIVASQQHFT